MLSSFFGDGSITPMPPDETARPSSSSWVTVASYNIHSCIGGDRRRDPERIAEVIREIDPEVIGLQEVRHERSRDPDADQLDYLARATGLEPLFAPTMDDERFRYGNALLTSGRIVEWSRHDLSQPGREPRLAIASTIELRQGTLGSIVFHLGLKSPERRLQAGRLVSLVPSDTPHPYVLLGDFNEWGFRARSIRECEATFAGCRPAPRSFPARFPVFALDRIWAFPPTVRLEVKAHRSALARVASDHLPVVGRIALDSW